MSHRSLHIMLILYVLMFFSAFTPRPAPVAPEHLPIPNIGTPFGLNTHLATRYPDPTTMNIPADRIAQSGATWAREDFHWYRIQPDANTWDWTFTDAAMRELIRRDITIVAVLGHPPGWATPFGGDDPSALSFYEPDTQRFATFAQTVVARYGRYIHHWEIWNEPDNPLFWRPTPNPEHYALLLTRAAAAIRQSEPTATIVSGGINPYDTDFLRRVAESGAWKSFDVIAIHPYIDPTTPEDGNIIAAADGVQTLASQLGDKPIWVTEIGWASGPSDHDPKGVGDEQTQANNLVRALLLLWRSGIERTFWYTLKDDPGNPYGLIGLGTGRADYSILKPAFDAFRTLNEQLSDVSFITMRDPFVRTTVLDFETLGAWRRGDQPYGALTADDKTIHRGRAAAKITYRFPTAGNDYVVFRRDPPAALPDQPYALGLWVYGDGSGNTIKIWLRDNEGEVLQYPLGTIGPSGWRLLQVPLNVPVASWNRITQRGNGRLDFPVRLDAIVVDDAPDAFVGTGTISIDDMIAINGAEAYDLQLQRGDSALDILWAPTPVRARISSAATSARFIGRDGVERSLIVENGALELNLSPAPIYIQHRR